MKNIAGSSHVFALLSLVFVLGCSTSKDKIKVTVLNKLDIDRPAETVSIPAIKIEKLIMKYGIDNILVRDIQTDSLLVTQKVDDNLDGKVDEVIFQVNMKPNEKKELSVEGINKGVCLQPISKLTTYSRFVPERIDDYAWENDRVAFRAYGPAAQKNTELGLPDSTLSSGMDCWLKRVSYPIINKWYKKNQEQKGYYHIDHGEGYDPYHVGPSRGCGGIGIWDNNRLYVSKNYISYKSIATGPIRTIFELTYAPWDAGGQQIKETKRISLDLGSNLTRYEETLVSNSPINLCTIGITLHAKKGEVKTEPSEGWFRYWEPMDSSKLGTGVVIAPAMVKDYKDFRVEQEGLSHLFVSAALDNTKVVYYAGFGWEKSGQFKSKEDWDSYLRNFAKRLASPLEVEF